MTENRGELLFKEGHGTRRYAYWYWWFQVSGGLVFLGGLALIGGTLLSDSLVDNAIMFFVLIITFVLAYVVVRGLTGGTNTIAIVYQEGMVVEKPDVTYAFTWDDIRYVREDTYAQDLSTGGVIPSMGFFHSVLWLELNDGQQVDLDGRFIETTQKIRRELTLRRFPAMVKAIDAGESVAFGPLEATADGLRNGDERVRWDEIPPDFGTTTSISNSTRGLFQASVDKSKQEIPNLWLLEKLINHYAPPPS